MAEDDWFEEGTVTDTEYIQSSFFGIHCFYTSTRSSKFSFDDIQVNGNTYNDLSPPLIDTVFSTNEKSVIIKFNEPVDGSSAAVRTNYVLNDLAYSQSVTTAGNIATLEFENAFTVINKLTVSAVEDLAFNKMSDTTVQFIYIDQTPITKGEIIINEIMADPTPQRNLPEIEYVELHNISNKAINMTNWSYSDKTTTANFSNVLILPD